MYAVGGHNINVYEYEEPTPPPSPKKGIHLSHSSPLGSVTSDTIEPETRRGFASRIRFYATPAATPFRKVRCKCHHMLGFEPHITLEEQIPLTKAYLTCRQIYQETVLLFYSANIFSFDNFCSMYYFQKCLLPAQKQAVNTVVQHTTSGLAGCFHFGRNLKTLYIQDYQNHSSYHEMVERSKFWQRKLGKGLTVKFLQDGCVI